MRRLGILITAAAVAVALAGCSVTGALRTATSSNGGHVVTGQAYAPGPRGGVDVYVPKDAAGAPVVVFFYGGSWDHGERALYGFLGKALAARGFVTVIPDYRLYPEVGYPDFLRDNARAVRWARDHAREFGGDPDRIMLMGHSAGAYNAVSLALDKRWLAEAGMDADRDIRAYVGLSGPYDFLPIVDTKLKVIFGPKATWPATQPIAYAHAGAVPGLLVTGDKDGTVDPGNADRLARRLREVGAPVEVRHLAGMGHIGVVAAFAAPLRGLGPVLNDVTEFLRRQGAAAPARVNAAA